MFALFKVTEKSENDFFELIFNVNRVLLKWSQ